MRCLVASILASVAVIVTACGQPQSAEQRPSIDATVQARVQATLAASAAKTPETQPPKVTSSSEASTPTLTPKTPTLTVESSIQQQIARILDVIVTGMSQLPTNANAGRYSDYIAFEMQYENKGDKTIRAFTGVLTFSDLFDRTIKKLQLTYDSPIAPKQKVIDKEKTFKVNQFMDEDMKLYNSKLENLHVTFAGQSVIFDDGSRLGKVIQ
jgi:hypothetical protein